MALLNRKVDYALLILAHLRQKGSGACAREIADRFDLSRPFVANILKDLCHKGFVTSQRGVKGGYLLARPPETVNFADFLDALDESFQLVECNQAEPDAACTVSPVCPIRGPLGEVHRRIKAVLRGITLADLLCPTCAGEGLISLEVHRQQTVKTGEGT